MSTFSTRLIAGLLALIPCGLSQQLAAQPTPEPPSATTVTDPMQESVPATGTQSADSSAAQQAPEPPTAVPFQLPREHHPWARFEPGAWREIRITTEAFDPDGKVLSRSVTTQQEVLESVTTDSYVLKLQATVELVGKRIEGAWQTRVLQLATDGEGQISSSLVRDATTLQIGGQSIDCQVCEIRYREDAEDLIDRIYYSPEHFPHVVQRESALADEGESTETPFSQKLTIAALDVPVPLGDRFTSGCWAKTVRRGVKGTSVRVAVLSETVPGGELSAWSTETDDQQVRVKWTTLELIDSGSEPRVSDPQTRRRLLRSRKNRRSNRGQP